ncbi:META domain-containing protein [Salinisphaera aquimarina]|uniref:META domain-containing protein n=1 Tax=Salinisphaera aquimarina TaxID=2094031 RepID=A0ABV7ESR3_9GAMM
MSGLRIPGFCLVMALTLALSACQSAPGASTHPDDALTNTYWKLVSVGGHSVQVQPNRREPHLVLVNEGQRVQGFAGCNSLSGRYRQDDEQLRFEQIVTTRMFCADQMSTEQAFLDALKRSVQAHIERNQLTLLDAGGRSLAHFESRVMQ